jgi:hypothetical protein
LAGSLVDRTDWLVLVSFFVPHNELSNTLAAIFSTNGGRFLGFVEASDAKAAEARAARAILLARNR